MKQKAIESIKNFCLDYGYKFVDDYSGRFMYGRLCVGIISPLKPDKLIELLSNYVDFNITGKPSSDNMGLEYIVYFENISVETFNRVAEVDKILDSDTINDELRNLLEKKDVVYSREYATTPDMNCPCCNKTLLTDYPKFCSECGTRLHYRYNEEG